MKQHSRFTPLLVLFLMAALGYPAAAAVIFADNFNTPAFPVHEDLVTYPDWGRLATTPSSQPGIGYNPLGLPGTYGWFVHGAGVDHISPTIGHVGSDGGAWVDLNALDAGSIEAAIVGHFTAGQNYTLSFMMNSASPGNSIAVEIWNGYPVPGFTPSLITTAVATPSVTAQPLSQSSWQPYSITFTADVTHNIMIKFTSPGAGAYGAFLDEVVVRDEVPEPTPWMMAGSGLVGLGLWRRKSRRQDREPPED